MSTGNDSLRTDRSPPVWAEPRRPVLGLEGSSKRRREGADSPLIDSYWPSELTRSWATAAFGPSGESSR